MNKTQHNDRYRLLNLGQEELERKWRLYVEQETQLMAMHTMPSGIPGGGGGTIEQSSYPFATIQLRYSMFEYIF